MPLPDESVHVVITSPPYWGLRDYGLAPGVWGGDSRCEHEWTSRRIRYQPKMWTTQTGELYPVQTVRPHREKGGDFCERCGAWRGSLGLEPTPGLYVKHIVEVMREIRRVLRKDGTAWLNLGDSYAGSWGNNGHTPETKHLNRFEVSPSDRAPPTARPADYGLKSKDLVGIPWRVAFALQADGWWLRSDIIWHKVNPMPEAVTDRPTRSHEFLFLLTKSRRYFFDQEAVREPAASAGGASGNRQRFVDSQGQRSRVNTHLGSSVPWHDTGLGRNLRTVWTMPTQPFSGAHFATFPESLVEPCVLAGTSEKGCCGTCGAPWSRVLKVSYLEAGQGNNNLAHKRPGLNADPGARPFAVRKLRRASTSGWKRNCKCQVTETAPAVVLDPFMGSGTVGVVALKLGRSFIGVDLKSEYVDLAERRIGQHPALAGLAVIQRVPERRAA